MALGEGRPSRSPTRGLPAWESGGSAEVYRHHDTYHDSLRRLLSLRESFPYLERAFEEVARWNQEILKNQIPLLGQQVREQKHLLEIPRWIASDAGGS